MPTNRFSRFLQQNWQNWQNRSRLTSVTVFNTGCDTVLAVLAVLAILVVLAISWRAKTYQRDCPVSDPGGAQRAPEGGGNGDTVGYPTGGAGTRNTAVSSLGHTAVSSL